MFQYLLPKHHRPDQWKKESGVENYSSKLVTLQYARYYFVWGSISWLCRIIVNTGIIWSYICFPATTQSRLMHTFESWEETDIVYWKWSPIGNVPNGQKVTTRKLLKTSGECTKIIKTLAMCNEEKPELLISFYISF